MDDWRAPRRLMVLFVTSMTDSQCGSQGRILPRTALTSKSFGCGSLGANERYSTRNYPIVLGLDLVKKLAKAHIHSILYQEDHEHACTASSPQDSAFVFPCLPAVLRNLAPVQSLCLG